MCIGKATPVVEFGGELGPSLFRQRPQSTGGTPGALFGKLKGIRFERGRFIRRSCFGMQQFRREVVIGTEVNFRRGRSTSAGLGRGFEEGKSVVPQYALLFIIGELL